MKDDADLADKYWLAYDFNNARSRVVHGAASQSEAIHRIGIRKANEMVTFALFRAFEVFILCRFTSNNLPTTAQGFFDQQENRWHEKFKELDTELVKKDSGR